MAFLLGNNDDDNSIFGSDTESDGEEEAFYLNLNANANGNNDDDGNGDDDDDSISGSDTDDEEEQVLNANVDPNANANGNNDHNDNDDDDSIFGSDTDDEEEQALNVNVNANANPNANANANPNANVGVNAVHGNHQYLPPLRYHLNDDEKFPDSDMNRNWTFSEDFVNSIQQDELGEDSHPNEDVPPRNHVSLLFGIHRGPEETKNRVFRPKRRKVHYVRFNNLRGQLRRPHNALREGNHIEPHPDFRDLRRATTLKRYDVWVPVFNTETGEPPDDLESGQINDLCLYPCEGPDHFLAIVQAYSLCFEEIRRRMRDYCDQTAYDAYRTKHELTTNEFPYTSENRKYFVHVSDRPMDIFSSPSHVQNEGYIVISPSGYYPVDYVRRVHVHRRPPPNQDASKPYGSEYHNCRVPYGSSLRYGLYDASYLNDPAPPMRDEKRERLFRYMFYTNVDYNRSVRSIDDEVREISSGELDDRLKQKEDNMHFIEKKEAMQMKNPYTWSQDERMEFQRYSDRIPTPQGHAEQPQEQLDEKDEEQPEPQPSSPRRASQVAEDQTPHQIRGREHQRQQISPQRQRQPRQPRQSRPASSAANDPSGLEATSAADVCSVVGPITVDQLINIGQDPQASIRPNMRSMSVVSDASYRPQKRDAEECVKPVLQQIQMPKPWSEALVDNLYHLYRKLGNHASMDNIVRELLDDVDEYNDVTAYAESTTLLRSIVEDIDTSFPVHQVNDAVHAALKTWKGVARNETQMQMIQMMDIKESLHEAFGILLTVQSNHVFYRSVRRMMETSNQMELNNDIIQKWTRIGIQMELLTHIVDPRLLTDDSSADMVFTNLAQDDDNIYPTLRDITTEYLTWIYEQQRQQRRRSTQYFDLLDSLRKYLCHHRVLFERVKAVVEEEINDHQEIDAITNGIIETVVCREQGGLVLTPECIRILAHGCGQSEQRSQLLSQPEIPAQSSSEQQQQPQQQQQQQQQQWQQRQRRPRQRTSQGYDMIRRVLSKQDISSPSRLLLAALKRYATRNKLSERDLNDRLSSIERHLSNRVRCKPPHSNSYKVLVRYLLSYPNPSDNRVSVDTLLEYNQTEVWKTSDISTMVYMIDGLDWLERTHSIRADPLDENHSPFFTGMKDYLHPLVNNDDDCAVHKRDVEKAVYAGLRQQLLHDVVAQDVVLNVVLPGEQLPSNIDAELASALNPFLERMFTSVESRLQIPSDDNVTTMTVQDALWLEFSKTGHGLLEAASKKLLHDRPSYSEWKLLELLNEIKEQRTYVWGPTMIRQLWERKHPDHPLYQEPTGPDVDFSVMGGDLWI